MLATCRTCKILPEQIMCPESQKSCQIVAKFYRVANFWAVILWDSVPFLINGMTDKITLTRTLSAADRSFLCSSMSSQHALRGLQRHFRNILHWSQQKGGARVGILKENECGIQKLLQPWSSQPPQCPCNVPSLNNMPQGRGGAADASGLSTAVS